MMCALVKRVAYIFIYKEIIMKLSNEELAKVMDKVRKLLNMSNDKSSPEEAAIAASRARKLMDKYDLSPDEIKEADEDDFLMISCRYRSKQCVTWVALLNRACAVMNDCLPCVVNNGGYMLYTIRGFKADAILAKEMVDYLMDLCNSLASDPKYKGRGEKNFFRLGFVDIITDRVNQVLTERMKKHASSNESNENDSNTHIDPSCSLVVQKTNAVTEFYKNKGFAPKITHVKTRQEGTRSEASAYQAGREAGNKVSLSQNEMVSNNRGYLE